MARAVDKTEIHSRKQVSGRQFTTAQVVGGILGMFLTIVGGVAVARMGLTPLTGETADVIGIAMTSLMGLILLVAGVSLLGASTSAYGVRGSLIGFGALAVAFGAIMLIEPSPFESNLGDAESLGALSLIVGVAAMIGGFTSRFIATSTVTTTSDEIADGHVVSHNDVIAEESVTPDDIL